MSDQETILQLIDQIYGGAMDSDLWPATLDGISRMVGGVGTDMYIENAGEQIFASIGGISDPDRTSPQSFQDMLGALYRLTPAEARLADALGAGMTVASAADACGVKKDTARIQLKTVFAKMNVNRQAEMVRLLASLAFVRPTAEPGKFKA